MGWKRHWNTVNRRRRAFTRAGPAEKEVKREPVHLNTRSQKMDVWAVSIARIESCDSWCIGCWHPDFWILVSYVMRHTCVLTEILSTWNITGLFLYSFIRHAFLSCLFQDQTVFFFNRSNIPLIIFKSFFCFFVFCFFLN